MHKVLIITSYFPPEIGAASNRISQLAESLSQKGHEVTVLTPLPNYPTGKIFKGYKRKFYHSSSFNSVNVKRLWIFANNSKKSLARLLSMMSYCISLTVFFLFHKIPKHVIIQSPPLLVAFSCIFFLKSRSRTLILNVSDLWPSAGLELQALKKGWIVNILLKLEAYIYKSSNIIMGQSEEILAHIRSKEPSKEFILYRNYPILNYSIETLKMERKSDRIGVFYAGLLGVAQGILDICKNLDYNNLDFHIYGDGTERKQIEQFIEDNPQLPIFYHGNYKREKLHKAIIMHDLAIIPLKKRIYGSVPSKIFEYATLGIPILYCGGGEGEYLIKKYKLGIVAKVGQIESINQVLNELNLDLLSNESRTRIYNVAKKHFVLENQTKQLCEHLQ